MSRASDPSTSALEAIPTTAFDPRFERVEPLGAGGMGRIFRAFDRTRGVDVALKLLAEESAEDRFHLEREIRTLRGLDHPAIVRLLDIGRRHDSLYYTMELLEGPALDELVQGPRLSAAELTGLLRATLELLGALTAIHARGLVHGDLKPAHILLVPDSTSPEKSADARRLLAGDSPRVKLIDFGLARVGFDGNAAHRESSARLDVEGVDADRTAGTPLYMAPEQLAGKAVDERTDLYAVGALLYHTITGRPLFDSLTAALTRRPSPPPADRLIDNCPPGLARLLEELTQTRPIDRPAGTEQVARVIRRLLSLEDEAAEGSRPPRLERPVFVGREEALGRLEETLRHAEEKRRGSVLPVLGPPGSGKSWLLDSSLLSTEMRLRPGMRFLSASLRRGEGEAGSLSSLLRDILSLGSEFVGSDSEHRQEIAVLERLFLRDVETLGPQRPDIGTEAAHDRVVDAALTILESTAEREPVVLAIDDVDAGDEIGRSLLRGLVLSSAERPLILIASCTTGRENEDAMVAQLLEASAGDAIRLAGFGDTELREFVRCVLSPSGDASDRLIQSLGEQTEGRPGALNALLAVWIASGRLEWHDGTWQLVEAESQSSAPSAIDLVGSLDIAQTRVLAALALIAAPANDRFLAAVLGEDVTEPAGDGTPTARTVRELAALGLVQETSSGWIAAPDSRRDRVTAELAAEVAVELHARIAELLIACSNDGHEGPWLRIARHLDRAAELRGTPPESVEYWLRGARSAERRSANSQALAAWKRALDLSAVGKPRAQTSTELGILHVRLGNYDAALERFHDALETWRNLARDCENPSEEAAARLEQLHLQDRLGRVHYKQRDLDAAQERFETLEREAADQPELRALAAYRLGSIAFDRGELAQAKASFSESLKLYDEDLENAAVIPVYLGLGLVERRAGDVDAAIERFLQAREVARTTHQPMDLARIEGNLGNLYRARGNLDQALDCLQQSTRARERVGDKQGLAICSNNTARVQLDLGDLCGAHAATERALELFESLGDVRGILISACNLSELTLLLGRPASAKRLIDEHLATAEERGGQQLVDNLLVNLAWVEHHEARYESAERLLRGVSRQTSGEAPREASIRRLILLAEGAIDRRLFERAEEALTEARFLAEPSGEMLADLDTVWLRALCKRGHLDAAREFARERLRARPLRGNRLERARFSREVGILFRELGPDEADRTEKHLGRAVSEFEAMGCPVEAAESLGEFGAYWSLLEEEEIAGEHFERGLALLSGDELETRRRRFTDRWGHRKP